jgi:hypothetical protein
MSVSNLLGLLCLAGVLTGCAAPRRDITLFTTAQLREHLDRLTVSGFDKIIDKYATQYGLPATYLYAIASRETNCRNILGDSENGVGLFQIDARHHPIAREFRETGQWRSDPEPLIAYGVELLAKNMRHAEQELHAFPRHVHFHVVASSYNCGTRALNIPKQTGKDSDTCTTGGNYAQDVLFRKAVFDEILSTGTKGAVMSSANE